MKNLICMVECWVCYDLIFPGQWFVLRLINLVDGYGNVIGSVTVVDFLRLPGALCTCVSLRESLISVCLECLCSKNEFGLVWLFDWGVLCVVLCLGFFLLRGDLAVGTYTGPGLGL